MQRVKTDFSPLLADPDCVIALVGASESPEKYGSIIYLDLVGRGYRVLGVNPNRDKVHGEPCYPSVKDLPVRPDIVDIVVPPSSEARSSKMRSRPNFDNVWLQPGAESAALLGSWRNLDSPTTTTAASWFRPSGQDSALAIQPVGLDVVVDRLGNHEPVTDSARRLAARIRFR